MWMDVWAWQSYMQVCILLLHTYHKGSVLLNDEKQYVGRDFASSHDQMALVDGLIFVTVLENWNWIDFQTVHTLHTFISAKNNS
jgi:hypothetical protein